MKLSALLIMALGFAPAAFTKDWTMDPAHSHVGFTIRHVFTPVVGQFTKVESSKISFDPAATKKAGSIEFVIDGSSVNTSVEKRDEHLRSKDFFDVEKYPKIEFKSTKFEKVEVDAKAPVAVGTTGNQPVKYLLEGNLKLHGEKKKVIFNVDFLGAGKGMNGTTVAGFTATTALKRSEYGMKTYLPMVGDEVNLTIQIEAGDKDEIAAAEKAKKK